MEELYDRLNAVPDAYASFVLGVIVYVKQKPGRLEKVMEYLNTSDSLTSSEIGMFIANQSDFHEFSAPEHIEEKENATMEELYNRLNAFPDAYFGFVMGVITYAKQKPERGEKILDYLNSSDNISTSDVIRFVSDQPDFHDFCVSTRQEKGTV